MHIPVHLAPARLQVAVVLAHHLVSAPLARLMAEVAHLLRPGRVGLAGAAYLLGRAPLGCSLQASWVGLAMKAACPRARGNPARLVQTSPMGLAQAMRPRVWRPLVRQLQAVVLRQELLLQAHLLQVLLVTLAKAAALPLGQELQAWLLQARQGERALAHSQAQAPPARSLQPLLRKSAQEQQGLKSLFAWSRRCQQL